MVDTSWLAIGHVDEVVNFVPAGGNRGSKFCCRAPKRLGNCSNGWRQRGFCARVAGTEEETTLEKLRMTLAGSTENATIEETVERIREQLKTDLNLEDTDFVMLPVLFRSGMAVIPNAVNSMAVNGHLLVQAREARGKTEKTVSRRRFARRLRRATPGLSSSIRGGRTTARAVKSTVGRIRSAGCGTRLGGPRIRR